MSVAHALLAGLVLAGFASRIPAQEPAPPPPPWEGGFTHSLGQPPRVYPYFAPMAGVQGKGDDRTGGGRLLLGLYRPVTNPLVGLFGLNAEGYAGLRDTHAEGGGRLMLASHFFRVAAGVDLNAREFDMNAVLSAAVAVRRGGALGTGSMLRLDWIPGRAQLELGVSVPLHRNAGKTRPREDHVSLRAPAPKWLPAADRNPALEPLLLRLRESIRRIDLLVTPLIDQGSGDPEQAARNVATELRGALDAEPAEGPPAVAEVRRYHTLLQNAFAVAAGDSVVGAKAAALARHLLLDHVLLPYNRLLGQRRSGDRLNRFQTVAWAAFVRNLPSTGVPSTQSPRLIAVFEQVLDAIEQARRNARRRWGDGRLVWLPLQYGLRPEDHDTQAELDSLVARAAERPFTVGNRIAYVLADLFQQELHRTIRVARDYHVLWIHDFAGWNQAASPAPDTVSLDAVVVYLEALTRAASGYDRTGRIPTFFLLLDQFYYERSGSRLWMSVLERPLDHEIRLPRGFERMTVRVREAQARLRDAVEASSLLQLEARQYGSDWIRNLIKVHVNITNPPDRSFNSKQILPLYGLPDDVMRDHRKVVFYDIDPDHPARGEAVFTGAGVGEQYVGPTWEDRAIIVQGPANLRLWNATRRLLEVHGLSGRRLPLPFRERPLVGLPTHEVPPPDAGGADARALQLHNETGYASKDLSVARATLYTLMPPASVVILSNGMWGDHLTGAMLLGAALRGGRVVLLAPSLATMSNTGWPSVTRTWELLSRLVRIERELSEEIRAAHGRFRIGMYDPRIAANDIRARFHVFAEAQRRNPWLDTLLAFTPAVDAAIGSLDSLLATTPLPPRAPGLGDAERPKFHLKGDLVVTGEGWDRLLSLPEFEVVMRTFAVSQARTLDLAPDGAARARAVAEELALVMTPVVNRMLEALPSETRARVAYYLLVGSANQNYRSLMLDGEAAVLVSGPAALRGLVDFIVLLGLCTWLDDPDQLDAFIPKPGGLHRILASWLRILI